jgi:hypothetical protein
MTTKASEIKKVQTRAADRAAALGHVLGKFSKAKLPVIKGVITDGMACHAARCQGCGLKVETLVAAGGYPRLISGGDLYSRRCTAVKA